MQLRLRLAALFCLAPALGIAESWSGALVDSRCYDSVTRNVNPTDTMSSVDRDKDWDVRYCTPKAKTRTFTVVPLNGMPSFQLDSSGNTKAAALVWKTGKKPFFAVVVTGQMSKRTVKVDSIAAMK